MQANHSTPDRTAIYARVSTEDQAERQTIQAQLDFLRRFCDLHSFTIAGEYVDDGISGTIPLDKRPEGRRLLDDAEARGFGVVLVYRLDRLGRSLTALLTAHDALDCAGVAIRSATEPFDTASPIGKFLFQLLGSLAELERSTIQDRMTLGRDRAAKAGKYTGGPIMLGYDVDADGYFIPSTRVVPALGITEADLVRDLFERIAAGSTLVREALRLQSFGVPQVCRYAGEVTVPVTKVWSAGRLWHMIRNPAYRGEAVVRSRHGTLERPFPALVDPALWDAAQAVLTRNRKLSKKNAKRVYLLRGLVVCDNCGAGFSGTATKSWARAEWRQYRCNGYSRATHPDPADRCRAKTIDADWIEGQVWDDLKRFINEPGSYLADAQRQLRERMAQSVDVEEQRRALLREIAEKETERDRVLTMYRRGRITMDEADQQLDEIARETGLLRQLVDSLRAQEQLTAAAEAHLTDTAAALARLRERVAEIEETNDLAGKREVMELLVHQIAVRTEGEGRQKRATIRLRYAYQAPEHDRVVSALPGRG